MKFNANFSKIIEKQNLSISYILLKKDYLVLLIQLDRNLASDVSTRCSGCPQRIWSLSLEDEQSIWSKRRYSMGMKYKQQPAIGTVYVYVVKQD